VKDLPDGTAIRGYGYDNNLFPGKEWPTKEDLDEAAPHNPVVIRRWDGHSIWVNSIVLKGAGIAKDTPDPQGGVIEKNSKTGEPTGILKETAMSLIKVKTIAELPPNKEVIQKALEYASRLGLTGIHTSSNWAEIEILKELNEEGRLPIRIYAWLPYEEIDIGIEKGIRQGQGNDMVKIGFLKLFIDGVIDAHTALLFKVFPEDPEYDHVSIYPEEEYYAMVEKAHKHGFQVGTHAIGDKGVNWCLNAVERAQQKHGKKDLRHRIEHSQVIHLGDAHRFQELGVIASMQPAHLSSDMNIYHTRSRKELAKRAYAWRTLIDNGAMLAFGTDWPVVDLDPMRTLYCCITRKNIESGEPKGGWISDQRISMEEAIKYQTLGPAYAAFEEQIKGTLEVGKLADMVVLSKDLFSVTAEEILDTKVLYTILGGKIVYSTKSH
jgi:predicted amidohydrolase YtcJ